MVDPKGGMFVGGNESISVVVSNDQPVVAQPPTVHSPLTQLVGVYVNTPLLLSEDCGQSPSCRQPGMQAPAWQILPKAHWTLSPQLPSMMQALVLVSQNVPAGQSRFTEQAGGASQRPFDWQTCPVGQSLSCPH